MQNTRRGLFGLIPAAAATAALPAIAVARTSRNIDAEIDHHVACIQALQQMRHPHIKSWRRMDVTWPDAAGYGSVLIMAYREDA